MIEAQSEIVEKVLRYHCLATPKVEIPAIFEAFESTPATRFLEIGTYQGATCSAVALAFPEAEVWTVDLPEPHKAKWNPQARKMTGCAYRELGIEHRIKQLWMDSGSLTQFVGKERFDVVFVDGDHSEEGCARDITTARELLTPDGIIVVHDYTDESDDDRPHWTQWVHKACIRFAGRHGFTVERLAGWLVALHQPGSDKRVLSPEPVEEASPGDEEERKDPVVLLHDLDPCRGHAPWRLKEGPSGERVLHLHIGTPDEPQHSLCAALMSVGSDGYICINWAEPNRPPLRELVLSAAKKLEPTLVFMQLQRGDVLDANTLVELRKLCADDAVTVHWTGDVTGQYSASGQYWTKALSQVCDLMLFSCMSHVRAHRDQGMNNAAYLQIGYDEDRYCVPVDQNSGSPLDRYGADHDVVFLGQIYNRSLIDRMTLGTSEASLRITIGERLIRDHGPRAGVFGSGWRGGVVSAAKSGDVYRGSHLAVSASLTSDLERYSSDRLLRALACGVPVLCKRFDDYESWGLRDGTNVVMFDDVADMADKIGHLLSGDAVVRKAIGTLGAKLALHHHSWPVRMRELMALVGAVRGSTPEVERPW